MSRTHVYLAGTEEGDATPHEFSEMAPKRLADRAETLHC